MNKISKKLKKYIKSNFIAIIALIFSLITILITINNYSEKRSIGKVVKLQNKFMSLVEYRDYINQKILYCTNEILLNYYTNLNKNYNQITNDYMNILSYDILNKDYYINFFHNNNLDSCFLINFDEQPVISIINQVTMKTDRSLIKSDELEKIDIILKSNIKDFTNYLDYIILETKNSLDEEINKLLSSNSNLLSEDLIKEYYSLPEAKSRGSYYDLETRSILNLDKLPLTIPIYPLVSQKYFFEKYNLKTLINNPIVYFEDNISIIDLNEEGEVDEHTVSEILNNREEAMKRYKTKR